MNKIESFLICCVLLLVCSAENDDVWNAEVHFGTEYSRENFVLPLLNGTVNKNVFTDNQTLSRNTSRNQTSFENTSLRNELNNSCISDLQYVSRNMDADWAQRMFNATSYPVLNDHNWHTFWPGNMEYCRTVMVKQKVNAKLTRFRGKYCYIRRVAKLQGGQNMQVKSDLCIPNTCSSDDILFSSVTQRLLRPWLSDIGTGINSTIEEAACRNFSKEFGIGAISMMCLIGLFVLLVAIGTSISIVERLSNRNKKTSDMSVIVTMSGGLAIDNEGHGKEIGNTSVPVKEQTATMDKLKEFFKCFCALANSSRIVDVKQVKDREPLLCFHGIRFLSMSWIIIFHTYYFAFNYVAKDELWKTKHILGDITFKGFMMAFYAVDCFFLLSGFLVTRSFLKEAAAKNGKITLWYFYFHRYWRLTPVYAMVIGFNEAIVPLLYEPFKVQEAINCSWWTNLLYINNFIDLDKTCIGWTWYLANDMQFYAISPLFLYPLRKWPKIGLSIIGTMLIGSIVTGGLLTHYHHLLTSSVLLFGTEYDTVKKRNYFGNFYIKPYARIQPYLIGVLLAYVMSVRRDKKHDMTPCAQFIGWVLATTFAFSVTYGIHEVQPSAIVNCFYNALSHTLWGIALAWVIYVCLTGCGGVVNWILTLDIYMPFSRLTYCVYLVHSIYILSYYNMLRTKLYITHMQMVTLFLGFFFGSYAAAFLANILIEAPLMALERLALKKK